MEVKDKISKHCCKVGLHSKKKHDVLKELVSLLKKSPMVSLFDEKQLYNDFLEREKLGSTALGKGIAIPHTKIEGLDDFVISIATSRKGVHFDAVDNKKVHIIFTLIGPNDKPEEYLQLLSSISRILKNKKTYNELLNAKTDDVLYETLVIGTAEEKPEKTKAEKKKLLIVVLYELQFLEDILEIFIESGISGSTVLDSMGMGGILTKVPLFADFTNFLGENKNYSKTILALIGDSALKTIVEKIEDLTGNLDKRHGASIIALDVCFIKGTMEFM